MLSFCVFAPCNSQFIKAYGEYLDEGNEYSYILLY